MRRLLPEPGETTPADEYTGLRLGDSAPDDRPYVVSNFAVTVDGRVTIQGRAGPIGTRPTWKCFICCAPRSTR